MQSDESSDACNQCNLQNILCKNTVLLQFDGFAENDCILL